MRPHIPRQEELDAASREFYRRTIAVLQQAGVPFLVGGAYAYAVYTGITRHTKDFDIFVRPADKHRALNVLSNAGYETELTFPHWLGKAFSGESFVDVIYSSGNGMVPVDELWFKYAIDGEVWGMPVKLIPAEEMIWSKSFIMERERFDGADIAHVIQAMGNDLDWNRLIDRFKRHWRVLLSHVVLFGYIYPSERDRIPAWVVEKLMLRLQEELGQKPTDERICQGSILSREQYLIDLYERDYEDARLIPRGNMTHEQIVHWTTAIARKK